MSKQQKHILNFSTLTVFCQKKRHIGKGPFVSRKFLSFGMSEQLNGCLFSGAERRHRLPRPWLWTDARRCRSVSGPFSWLVPPSAVLLCLLADVGSSSEWAVWCSWYVSSSGLWSYISTCRQTRAWLGKKSCGTPSNSWCFLLWGC